MDRIDATEKFELLKLYSAIAPRDDKGKEFKKYSIELANRMYADDKKQRGAMLHNIMVSVDKSSHKQ